LVATGVYDTGEDCRCEDRIPRIMHVPAKGTEKYRLEAKRRNSKSMIEVYSEAETNKEAGKEEYTSR